MWGDRLRVFYGQVGHRGVSTRLGDRLWRSSVISQTVQAKEASPLLPMVAAGFLPPSFWRGSGNGLSDPNLLPMREAGCRVMSRLVLQKEDTNAFGRTFHTHSPNLMCRPCRQDETGYTLVVSAAVISRHWVLRVYSRRNSTGYATQSFATHRSISSGQNHRPWP